MVNPTESSRRAQARTAPAWTVGLLCPPRGPAPALVRALEQEVIPYEVLQEEGQPAESAPSPDVLLVDATLADRRGAEALARRAAGMDLPALVALSAEQLGSSGLRLPAADIIIAPWHPGELALRVERALDDSKPLDEPWLIRTEGLVIDTNRYDVFVDGRQVMLTFKEYELLKLLAANPGRVYSREALLEQVWGYQYFGGTRTVDVHVRRLRAKIEDAQRTFIETVWNVGYRFRG
ncbi:MAG: response regulator transcription factor [Chloroflexota bacterium]